MIVRVLEYVDSQGRSPFAGWLERLEASAAAKVVAALYRIGEGNFSNEKGVGGEQRQPEAIVAARERWADYKLRRTKG